VTVEQELAKELEQEVEVNRQRMDHVTRAHEQQVKQLQQAAGPAFHP
jgi:hypothetical protein